MSISSTPARPARALAWLLSALMVVAPLQTTYANTPEPPQLDEFSQIGRTGQAFGKELAKGILDNPVDVRDGQIFMPGGTQLDVNTLYPGTNPVNADRGSEFFSDGTKVNVGELEGIYDSDNSMVNKGENTLSSLWDDAHRESPSVEGAAYKVILDSANLSKPDFRNDPMMKQTFDVFENIDLITEGFGDCEAQDTYKDVAMELHNPEYRTCEKVIDRSGECEIVHDYEAAVVKHHGGPYNVAPCGEGCTNLWIGRVGDNYWSGSCTIYEEYTEVTVESPEAVISATLTRAKWDDYMQILVGEPGKEVLVWQGPNNNFPPETAGACELATDWDTRPNTDLTALFKNTKKGDVLRFKIRVSVTGAGEGYGSIRINYDPSKAVIRDEWTPASCIESAQGVADNFASGKYECVDDPRDAAGCVTTNGIRICENTLKPSPVPNLSNMCRKVSVEADFDFYKGPQDCYTDIYGEEICNVNEGGNLDTCKALEADPQCGFISSKCVDGAQGGSGRCYVNEEVWDCGETVTLNTVDRTTEYQCAGAIRCMGSDCLDPAQSQGQAGNFARVSALLNAAQFMTQDMTCSGVDDDGHATGEENVECSVFGGEPGECKIAVGGVSDCCETPKNVSMLDYLNMLRGVARLDSSIMALGTDANGVQVTQSVVKSAYKTLRDPVTDNLSAVTKPFTSYMDNVSGSVMEIFDPVMQLKDELLTSLEGALEEQLQKFLGTMADKIGFGAGAGASAGGEAMGEVATEKVADTLVSQAGGMLAGAMAIYGYYQMAIAIIQMVYACEEEELLMNSKRAVDSCYYVGSYCNTEVLGACIEKRESYCCFNSPLSRIIQEQVRPQLGLTFGSPKNPTCGGIPISEIGNIDWDRVDLGEWLAILKQNNMFPEASAIDMESLTGAGSFYNFDGDRLPADQRAIERIGDIDIDGIRQEVGEKTGYDPRGRP